MRIRGQEIDPTCIVSLIPDRQAVVIKTKNIVLSELSDMSMNGMIRVKVNESEFQMAKFEYLRTIRRSKNPEDRVDPFLECRDEDGGIDLKRMDALIELRKLPSEKMK